MSVTLKDRKQLAAEFIRRFRQYTDLVTWFGPNSVMRAFALAMGGAAEGAERLYTALVRRITLMAASGTYLTSVAAERGSDRLAGQRAKVLVIVRPYQVNVTAITAGATDLIEVDDSDPFAVSDSIRIRNGDGTVTEIRTIIAITSGTGPSGGDELEVASLTGSYTPSTEDVDVLLRYTVAAGTTLLSNSGASFETLEAVTTGDSNPVLDGEGTFVGLADKVWCECTEVGALGNIDADTIDDFSPSIDDVLSVFNPEPGTGGADEETDYDLKYRTAHRPTLANQETLTWLEALLAKGNSDVLRAIRTTSSYVSTMAVKVLHRNGGPFSTANLTALDTYAGQRVRSYLTVECSNVTLTSVEVEAQITLDPDVTLEDVWKEAANRLASFLDHRKWAWGEDVDEADLLTIVNGTPGVATLVTATFLPASDVTVAVDSLPTLASLALEDTDSGDTMQADLAVSF
jgi:uncharacterized phage protein gp47/JayE